MEEKRRPQFHFTPKSNWMNDPNGMVFYNGEYHLFYQFHPNGIKWGPMHWGHAVSTDLVHWQHLPIALEPDEHGTIFSGSAVVDWNDTTGFFSGESGLVAIFTHNDTHREIDRTRQRQSLAYSTDDGREWKKYEGNPVLSDERITDFRDPKVFWHQPTNNWVMILATVSMVSIYTSPNLIEWTFVSVFGEKDGSHQGVWECPDLFPLQVDGDSTHTKWVMIVSIVYNPIFPEGSKTQYFIGEFDGVTFRNDNPPETVLWLDHGRDNYAGVSWSDIPAVDGRRIYMGWMNNWKYGQVTPTEAWRGAMTIPRVLTLNSQKDGIKLLQQPVSELESLRLRKMTWNDSFIGEGSPILTDILLDCYEIVAEFELDTAEEFGFKIRKSNSQATVIGYNVRDQEIFVDRSKSGEISFHPEFSGKYTGFLVPKNNRIKMNIWVDSTSVEVFANDGEFAATNQIFPEPSQKGMELFANNGRVKMVSLNIYPLKSIWK